MFIIVRNFRKSLNISSVLISSHHHQYKMSYYAVASGREIGIYKTWAECEKNVKGYSNPKYKKFKTKAEAEVFLESNRLDKPKDQNNEEHVHTREDAVPLGKTKRKEAHDRLVKLVERRFGKSKDAEIESPPPAKEIEDSWPDDVEFEEGDDSILLVAAAEVEGISHIPLKRKNTNEENDSGPSGPKVQKKYSHESKIWEPVGLKYFGKFEFAIDSEGFVIVYTDGSCINNGQANPIAGYGVYFGEDHPLNAGKPVKGRVTNNAGEIQGAIHAINVAKDLGIQKLCLSTDSQFVIDAATSWIKTWKRKGWKLQNGGEVKNKEDFMILDRLLDGSIQIKWNYVKGHKGIIGNERADQLARKGAELYRYTANK